MACLVGKKATLFFGLPGNLILKLPSFNNLLTLFSDQECQYWLSQKKLLSPYYPNDYDNNVLCVWNITAGENFIISLVFETFDVQTSEP